MIGQLTSFGMEKNESCRNVFLGKRRLIGLLWVPCGCGHGKSHGGKVTRKSSGGSLEITCRINILIIALRTRLIFQGRVLIEHYGHMCLMI